MHTPRTYIALILLCIVSLTARAQFVNYGSDPSGYKWNIVKTNRFQVIYPQGTDSMAYRYASLLETAYPHVKKSLGTSMEKQFPVVLHPGNMLSNGMVSWAPRRMEIITTPASDLYAQQWDRQLTLHETRHIIQTSKVIRGVFKPLYYLIGEQSAGIASFLLPAWFLEGDAVATETALSNSGRGRLPEFSMVYRARTMTNSEFSYDKWFLGSYKDYTGSKYSFGYNLTAFARHQYGADIWDRVISRYADRILNIPPFTSSLKHHTGISPKQLHRQTFDFLKQEWDEKEKEYRAVGMQTSPLSELPNGYTAYKYPQAVNESTIIAVKSDLKDINSLVSITNGEEKRICYLGSINSRISLSQNRIYWSEYVSGTRWTHLNHSVVKYFDRETGKIETLTPRQRYLSPTINRTGSKLGVTTTDPSGKNRIVIIDAHNGNVLSSHDIPGNEFAKEIVYAENDEIIAATVGTNGISLKLLDSTTGEWKEILSHTWANIASLTWENGCLYFESGLDGTNNIYRLDPKSATPYKLTTARFGAFTPTLSKSGKELLFADFQPTGYQVVSVPLADLKATPANFNNPYKHRLAEAIAAQEEFNLDTLDIAPIEFNPKRYRKLPHLFKIHSWAPFYYDVSDVINMDFDDFTTIVKPGATILSQNRLNTAITQAGWYYKDGYHHGKVAFTYTGWYPVLDFNIDYGDRAFRMSWVTDQETEKVKEEYRYTNRNLIEAEARVYIPFNLTRNHYIKGFQPSVSYFYTNNQYQQYKSGKHRDFQYMLSELRFYNYRRMAKQDILPKWGYQLRLQHLFSPFNSENYGHLYAARLTTYLPGLFANNGLMLRFAYQYQDLDGKALYLPKKIMTEPRGYNYLYRTHQQMALSADYSFSIAKPDFSIGPLAYIQRIRSNVFYDLYRNQARNGASWGTQSSVGLDLIADCNLIQIEFPIAVGARVIQPIDYGNLQVEALFSISF